MASPRTPYDAVLHAARDVIRVDTALDAELVGAALLGSVYTLAPPNRAAGMREFVGEFLEATARRRSPAARVIRRVFATLVPDATGAETLRAVSPVPAWLRHLGRVRPVGAWAYGDLYGDQTSYLATFAYDDPDLGGPEHAVVLLVDHNLGMVKDLVVGRPAQPFLEEIHKAAESDDLVWLRQIDLADLRAQVTPYLEITDAVTRLPEDGSLATDRALVQARLATLPVGGSAPVPAFADPQELASRFLDTPYGAVLLRAGERAEATVRNALRLILDFRHDSPDLDPLRWSPAVVGLFLLDWVHRRAVLDDQDVALLPVVLRAWTAWAAAERALPGSALADIHDAIDTMAPELVRLHGAGQQPPAPGPTPAAIPRPR